MNAQSHAQSVSLQSALIEQIKDHIDTLPIGDASKTAAKEHAPEITRSLVGMARQTFGAGAPTAAIDWGKVIAVLLPIILQLFGSAAQAFDRTHELVLRNPGTEGP